jgi:Ca2+-binding RTX toxin-like protein
MRITVSIAAFTSLIALAAFGAASAAASVPVDLRVASNDGGNLADVIQYVPTSTTVKTASGPDCFNPAKESSGKSYTFGTPTFLGAIWEASQAEPALQPVRLSDADFASFGALGVCQIHADTPPPFSFFYLKANHQSLQVGANLFTVQAGDQLLAYRTPSDGNTDEELDLTAPVRAAVGAPVTVSVRSYTSPFSSAGATVQPRAGALIVDGGAPVQSDASGNATLTFAAPGTYQLTATGEYDDIPSPTLSVCVAANPDTECPLERGREILGSDEAESIKGTDGPDTIKARDGNDVVKAGAGDDNIVVNGGGSDQVFCGGGTDTVTKDKSDKISKSCEIVNGKKQKKHKKHKHHKRHGKGKHGK